MSARVMLEATGLEKRFGAVVAASAINVQITAGERVSFNDLRVRSQEPRPVDRRREPDL